MGADSLLDLYERLWVGRLRETVPHSQDSREAIDYLHYPSALDHELAEGMAQWCMKREPRQFGRMAASKMRIHFCFLREIDLAKVEKGIAERIVAAKRLWKQRAILDKAPPHGFMLGFASPRVALAAPDDNLRRFSEKLLELVGWGPDRRGRRRGNAVASDFLDLKHPTDGFFVGYQFNVDYFAVLGYRRWLHDHRGPGGMAFTANSTCHMRYFKDWYGRSASDHGEWAAKQATITQARAAAPAASGTPGADGRVTWLRDLGSEGRPLLSHVPCPLSNVPGQLQGRDRTRYEGVLQTDHAERAEFFADRPRPITAEHPYVLDHTPLHDKSQADFVNFMAGVSASPEDVYLELCKPESWGHTTRVRWAQAARMSQSNRRPTCSACVRPGSRSLATPA